MGLEPGALAKALREQYDKAKSVKFTKNTWWEVTAYAIRVLSCVIPALIIMYQEHSWQKASLSLMGSLLVIAIVIIMFRPIKALFSFAPGVLPFAIFVGMSFAFKTMADAFLTIGISGLIGSVIAIPFHYRYIQGLSTDDPFSRAIQDINSKLDNFDAKPH